MYFEEAERLGGLPAKIRLASLAKVTSAEAAGGEDTPDLIARLGRAMDAVKLEFRRRAEQAQGNVVRVDGASDQTRLLRSYLHSAGDLLSQRSLFLQDVTATVRRIDETAAAALDVARVSVWFLDDAASKITCADLFERREKKHSSGTELFAKDFAPYFEALKSERTIAASDAHTDPRTSCFSAPYLAPLGIGAMLDVPIWLGPKMAGVICHEHVGGRRSWNSDEESFAYLLSNIVSLALERRERK